MIVQTVLHASADTELDDSDEDLKGGTVCFSVNVAGNALLVQ